MSGRTGSCKGVKNDGVTIGGNSQNAFDQTRRLGSIKSYTSIEDRTDLLLRPIGMPSNLIRPKVRRKQPTHTI